MPKTGKLPPSHRLTDTLDELDKLCEKLRCDALGSPSEDDTHSGTPLKIFSEYRQLLKLKFDVLKSMSKVIDDARFQNAVLHAIEEVDQATHDRIVESLLHLDEHLGEDADFREEKESDENLQPSPE